MPHPPAWPIADRPAVRDAVRRRLLASPPRVQALTGPSGIGKTTLADGIAATLASSRRRVIRIAGTTALATIPLGALSPHLAGARGDVDERLRRFLEFIGGRAGSAVVLVDDAPLLDEVSAAAVYQLVRVFGVPVLLTARDGMTWPDALRRLEREGLIDATVVPPLTHADAAGLLERRLGERTAPDSLNALLERTGGNPLFLRRTVEAAEREGGIAAGPHGLHVEAPVGPAEIDDLLAASVGDLEGPAQRLAGLLALTGPLPADLLPSSAEPLLAAGLAVRERGVVRLAHPLIAEAALGALPAAAAAGTAREAAALLGAVGDRGSQLAALRLELSAGLDVPPERIAAAAADARAAGDHPEAVRLARRAIEAGHSGARPWWDLGAALSAQGLLADADSAFAEGWRRGPDAAERLAGASLHGEHLAYRRFDLTAAIARAEATIPTLPARLRPLLDAEARIWRTLAGSVVAETGPVALDRDAPLATVRAAMAAVLSGSMSGGREAARHSAGVIDVALREFGALDPLASSMIHLQRFFDELGAARGDAAWDVIAHQRLGPVSDAAGIWSYTLGVYCAYDGRLAEGAALADLAAEQLRWRDLTGLLGAAVALQALFARFAGDAARADELVAGLVPPQRAEPRAAMLLAEGAAWESLRRDDLETAIAILSGAAAGAIHGGYSLVGALTASLGVRAGAASAMLPLLELAETAAGGENVLIAALRDLAVALDRDEVRRALEASAIVARAGMRATAADALAQIAPAATTAEERRAVGLALDRARRGLDAPLLRARMTRAAAPTDRERELVELAAQRLSNAEIAARVGISVRTVENHLSRFYAKTGLRSRAELRAWGSGAPETATTEASP